jgi:putative membrane protein
MDRKLVLVVDRDDDFGVKAGIDTPVIGYGDCMKAAS